MTMFDQRAFRSALGCFPTGVTIVTAPNPGGDPIAMTVSSFNAVSLDPPLVLFSVKRSAFSLPVLLEASHFAVSVLRGDQTEISARFAHAQGAKWAGLEPRFGATGCPLASQGLATFECEPHAVHDGGDHLIIIGRVVSFEVEADGEPLIFFRGGYHSIAARA
ncbi:MAG: flavin reductase family protein [Sphingomonas sp.]|nr:flavin reductase family protein [Sphingomonas sp.]